jgi:hypothetical protein
MESEERPPEEPDTEPQEENDDPYDDPDYTGEGPDGDLKGG